MIFGDGIIANILPPMPLQPFGSLGVVALKKEKNQFNYAHV
jgi:hypothetical protein